MPDSVFDAGSFRDPAGRIVMRGDRVFRTVHKCAMDDFEFVEASGLLSELANKGWVIDAEQVELDTISAHSDDIVRVLEHPRIPLVSYPYEWAFSGLKSAALLHLDVHLAALERDITLSDASAYNVQFIGPHPIFIDYLSFVRYREGSFWEGHKQFCEQFLNPLLLHVYFGVAHNSWYRGALEGISVDELTRLLPTWRKFAPKPFIHLVLQSFLQKRSHRTAANAGPMNGKRESSARLPKPALQRMLLGLRKWISGFQPRDTGETVWQNYADSNSYSSEEAKKKEKFIEDFISATGAKTIWDFGCNTGHYLAVALNSGATYGVGFDFDLGALEGGIAHALKKDLPLQFLFLDAANPSPDQGWSQMERKGLRERSNADALLALAFVHHLAIAKNIPLDRLINWLVDFAPKTIVEFVPKQDPMVQELLRNRADIFPNYTADAFRELLSKRCDIIREEPISKHGRQLFWVERRH